MQTGVERVDLNTLSANKLSQRVRDNALHREFLAVIREILELHGYRREGVKKPAEGRADYP